MSEIPYHIACGPLALAAISGLDSRDVAGQLATLARARGRVLAPLTAEDDMEYWLVRRGFDVKPWDVLGDTLLLSAHERAEQVRTPRPVGKAGISLVERLVEASPHIPREELEADVAKLPLLTEWVAAHPTATWLVYVQDHVLAFSEGRVLAGDFPDLRLYGSQHVEGASKIRRKTNRTPETGEPPCPKQ